MKKKILCYVLCFLFLSNCGFKIVNQKDLRNFKIIEIDSKGDKRINFKLKNKLNINQNLKTKYDIKINLNTIKTKNIKEKNIKNEITKYSINILVDLEYSILGISKVNKISVSKFSEFNVSNQHSKTLNSEKSLINILVEDIASEITDSLILELNEL